MKKKPSVQRYSYTMKLIDYLIVNFKLRLVNAFTLSLGKLTIKKTLGIS